MEQTIVHLRVMVGEVGDSTLKLLVLAGVEFGGRQRWHLLEQCLSRTGLVLKLMAAGLKPLLTRPLVVGFRKGRLGRGLQIAAGMIAVDQLYCGAGGQKAPVALGPIG